MPRVFERQKTNIFQLIIRNILDKSYISWYNISAIEKKYKMEPDWKVKYNVEWQRKATKQLDKIQAQQRTKIREATRKLENSETWGDVKKLVNHQYDYRLRVGNYRILFDATNDETIEINEISIEEVKKRDDRTY